MSGQGAKKKRLGSRRGVKSRHETAEEENKYHVTQQHIAEESTESKRVLSEPDESKPSSPEVPASKRKLGSSRKLKGRQHVKDSETEAVLGPGGEVEAVCWGNKTEEAAQMSVPLQLERKEEVCQVSERDASAAGTSSSCFAHNSEFNIHTPTICPEELMETLGTRSKNTLEEFKETSSIQSEERKENLHDVETFETTGVSFPLSNEEFNIRPLNSGDLVDELPPEMRASKRNNDTELRHLEGNHLVNESNTAKITTGQSSPTENVEVEHDVKQVTSLSPDEEFPANQKQTERFNFSELESDSFHHSLIPDSSKNVQPWQAEIENTPEFLKQQQHFEESKEEVSKNTNDEMPETVTVPLTTEVTHEELHPFDHIVSEPNNNSVLPVTTPDYFYEVPNSSVANSPQTNLQSLLPESKKCQEEKDEEETGFKVEMFNESLEDKLEGSNESHTVESQDVRDAHYPDDVVKTELEEESESEQTEEMMDSFYSCESLLDHPIDADSEITNLTDQTETTSTNLDLIVMNADQRAAKKKESNPDCKLDEDQIELCQVSEVKNEVTEEVKLNTDHRDQDNVSASVDEQTETDFGPGGDQHQDDDVKNVQEDATIQIQQKPQIHLTSEVVPRDAAESSDCALMFANLTEQTEILDTSLDFSVKDINDLTTEQQNLSPHSDPGDKQDEKHTEESRSEDSDQKNAACFVDDSKLRGDVYESEDKFEEEVQHSTEQTVDQDGILSLTSPSQQLDSFDSQHQEYSPGDDEQAETGFNLIKNRRKLGSSRRNTRKQQVKESEDAVAKIMKNHDTPEFMTLSSADSKHEESGEGCEVGIILSTSHNSATISSTPECSSEALNISVTNYQETELESLISQTVCGTLDETLSGFKVAEFDKKEETTSRELDKSNFPENEGVRGGHYSEEDGKEIEQMEEKMPIYPTYESVLDDASESHNWTAAEIRNLHQCEVMEINPSELDPVGPHSENDKEEENLETSDQRNDNYHFHHSENPEISDVGRPDMTLDLDLVDTSKSGVEDVKVDSEERKELISDTEEQKSSSQNFLSEAPVDSRPSNISEATEEDEERGFHPDGNRRKLASSRRRKVRWRGKDSVSDSSSEPTEEANGRTAEASEATEIVSTIETSGLEASVETKLEETNKSDTSQLEEEMVQEWGFVGTTESTFVEGNSRSAEDQQVIAQSYSHNEPQVCQMKEEISTEDTIPIKQTEAKQRVDIEINLSVRNLPAKEERLLEVEGSQYLEDDTVKDEEPEVIQALSLAQDFPECLINQSETSSIFQSELAVKSTEEFLTKETDSNLDTPQDPSKQDKFEKSDQRKNNERDTEKPEITDLERIQTAHGDMTSGAEKTPYQDNKGHFSETEDSDSSPQSLQCLLDSQQQQHDASLGPGGSPHKLKSSQEQSMETMLEGKDEANSDSTEHMDVEAKPEAHFVSHVPVSELIVLTADRQPIESVSSKKPDEGLFSVSEIKKTDEVQMGAQIYCDDSLADVHLEYQNPSMTANECSGRISPRKPEVEQEKFSSQEQVKAENEEHVGNLISSEVTDAHQFNDDLNKTPEEQSYPVPMQEMQETSFTSDLDHKFLLQTSETKTPLKSVNDEDQTDIKPSMHRKKMGSSRRHKRWVHAREDESHLDREENTEQNNKPDTTPLTTEATTQEDSGKLKTAKNETEFKLTENNKRPAAEDSILTLNQMNNSASATSDVVLSLNNSEFLTSNMDCGEEDKKPAKETENSGGLAGSDTVSESCRQPSEASVRTTGEADVQSNSTHNGNTGFRSGTEDVLKEARHVQNTQVLSVDKSSLGHEISAQQTNDVKETVAFVEITEKSVDVSCPAQEEVEGNCELSAARGTKTVPESESVAQVPTVDASDNEMETCAAMDAANKSESEQNDLEVKPKQRRRKLGSTRNSRINRKPEEAMTKGETPENDSDTEVRNLDTVQVVEELLSCAEVSQSENAPSLLCTANKDAFESCSAPELQSNDGNVMQDVNYSSGVWSKPSAAHNAEVVNPVSPFNVSESERNMTMQLLQTDSFTSTEGQNSSGGNSENPSNTENAENSGFTGVSFIEATKKTHSEEKSQSQEETQDDNEHKPNNEKEEEEEETQSRNLNIWGSVNKRRKMGSTRRSLGSQIRRKDLDQTKEEEEDEEKESETPSRNITGESIPEFEEEQRLHTEDKDSDSVQSKEKVLKTVEKIHSKKSQLNLQAQQRVSQSQPEPAETESQLGPSGLSSTSETMSELASGGRRRKMGSHRKPREAQRNDEITDAEKERHVITKEAEIKVTEEHRDEPVSRDRPSQVDPVVQEPSSSISEPLSSVSEKNPRHAEISLMQIDQKHFSLGGDCRSSSFNVVMIGDTSVGKTSFMKRAQSGKFSLDLPSSVGLDSYIWTVVIDGKPVVLHVWDTAGQERFRSITRQVLHRAQAFLLMYDVSSSQSFSAVSYWATCIQESAPEDVIVLLLGNKNDCAERRVKAQQGEILAKEYNFGFMECSAATGENVLQSLETVARMLDQRCDSRNEATVLHKEPGKKKKSSCC